MQQERQSATVLERVVCAMAGAALVVIMVTVAADVLMRYAFNSPLSWSFVFISEYMTPAAFFFALAATMGRRHHVAVDILYDRFGPRTQRLCRLLTTLLALPVFAAIAWLATVRAYEAQRSGDTLAGAIAWPTWIPSAMAAFGVALLVMRLLHDLLAALRALASTERFGSAEPVGEARDV